MRILVACGCAVNIDGDFKAIDLAFFLLTYGMLINLNLAVFNLIPLFPLDGHHIGRETLPAAARQGYMHWQIRYGMYAFLLLWIGPQLLRWTTGININPLGWYLGHVVGPMMDFLIGKSGELPAWTAFLKFEPYLFWRH